MKVALVASHEIAEFDDVRMFHDLGLEIFSIGAYTNPTRPDLTMEHGGRGLRPPLPDVPYHADLAEACEDVRRQAADNMAADTREWMIDPAKGFLHPDVIEWADVIICHHFPERWLVPQWQRIKHKRVIWRTCGQSNASLEQEMAKLDGLQVVRYSPKEREAFTRAGAFAGEDALIRFGKYPADFREWIGTGTAQFGERNAWTEREEYGLFVGPYIANVTQNMRERGDHCGYGFWMAATQGLPARPAGKGSEQLPGGFGEMPLADMYQYLQRARAYLYMGTQPASYTLGLMEAMLSGTPVVSMGPDGLWMPDLFEGHEIAAMRADTPELAREALTMLLDDPALAQDVSTATLRKGRELFDVAKIGQQWFDFLGVRRDAATKVSPWDAVLA